MSNIRIYTKNFVWKHLSTYYKFIQESVFAEDILPIIRIVTIRIYQIAFSFNLPISIAALTLRLNLDIPDSSLWLHNSSHTAPFLWMAFLQKNTKVFVPKEVPWQILRIVLCMAIPGWGINILFLLQFSDIYFCPIHQTGTSIACLIIVSIGV